MPEFETGSEPVLYDHEQDPEGPGRRRRVADWGGDDLFTSVPRRRFGRIERGARRGTRDERHAGAHRTGGDQEHASEPRRTRVTHERRVSGPAGPAPAVEEQHGPLPAGFAPPPVDDPAADGIAAVAGESAPAAGATAEAFREPAEASGAEGRRTVLVTGRPGALGEAARPAQRRRPPQTVGERLGSRPDRVAGWACGMGLLLILIAVSTADAAPL